ncbi:MAG: hypothetical protein KAJ55_02180 [Anaerolineales bacterium]|nr:hypothetical protein [Anaerolineales bacterium]
MQPPSAIITENEVGRVQEMLNRMHGKGKYCINPHGDVLQFPDLPEGTRAIFYTHYIADDLTINGKPSITVALLFELGRPSMITRGISICSPEENAIKKEGRIRAIGRALRAWNKKASGPLFVHPRAISVIKETFIPADNDMLFSEDTAPKYSWKPLLSKFEEKIVSSVILGMALRKEKETDA